MILSLIFKPLKTVLLVELTERPSNKLLYRSGVGMSGTHGYRGTGRYASKFQKLGTAGYRVPRKFHFMSIHDTDNKKNLWRNNDDKNLSGIDDVIFRGILDNVLIR